MHHELKIHPAYFEAVLSGDKTFEIRHDADRGFQKGDTVTLREFDPKKSFMDDYRYTGRELKRVITYVTAYEQKPGWVVFSHNEDRP